MRNHFVMNKVSIILILFLLLLVVIILSGSVRETFGAVTGKIPTVDPGSIDIQRPATEILKDLAQDADTRYLPFFGKYDGSLVNQRSDQKFPLLWPLTTGDINSRLSFDPSFQFADYTYKKLIVTSDPPSQERIWFAGSVGTNPNDPKSQIRSYDPSESSDANNFLGGWYWGVAEGNPYSPYYGGSCPRGKCDSLVKDMYSNPFSLTTSDGGKYNSGNDNWQTAPSIVHCYTGQKNVQDAFNQQVVGQGWKPYPYFDGNSPMCVWKTDQEAYGCCTSSAANNNFSPEFKSMCAPAFMPSATTTTSLCQPLMLSICETNWDSDACNLYLESWQRNSDVRAVVQTTVANYINNMANKYPCEYADGTKGTNDYTSPSIGKICRLTTGSNKNAPRDDSQDSFLNNTLFKLCTADYDKTTTETSRGGICDNILNQYCAQFTRDELLLDNTLRKICGCHLPVPDQKIDLTCDSPGAPPTCLKYESPSYPQGISKTVQTNQYPFPETPQQCDPICESPGVIPNGGPSCTQTVCIIDNVNIDMLSSSCHQGITINQVCGGTTGDGTGNCYISDVDVNLINSDCGGILLNQACNACFTYPEGEPWNVTKVPCCDPANNSGGQCTSPGGNGGGDGGGSSGGIGFSSWLRENATKVGIAIAVLGILIMFIGMYMYFTEKPKDVESTGGSDAPVELPPDMFNVNDLGEF